jgi:hypothetical protein
MSLTGSNSFFSNFILPGLKKWVDILLIKSSNYKTLSTQKAKNNLSPSFFAFVHLKK